MVGGLQTGVLLAVAAQAAAFSVPRSFLARHSVVRAMSSEPRRDEKGYIVKEDLKYDTESVSTALGASGRLYEFSEDAVKFLDRLKATPSEVSFEDTMAMLETGFDYLPKSFSCGDVESAPGSNEGSCKILSFAKLAGLDADDIELTLNLFGDYYRKDVLENPDGDDHGNIRNLIKYGWEKVKFPTGLSVSPKSTTFDINADVGDMLDSSSVVSGDDEWDPDSDSWIP